MAADSSLFPVRFLFVQGVEPEERADVGGPGTVADADVQGQHHQLAKVDGRTRTRNTRAGLEGCRVGSSDAD